MPEEADCTVERSAKIAALNDALRVNIDCPGTNRIVMTQGVKALMGTELGYRAFHNQAELLRLVRDFDTFTEANDPYGERDFGRFEFGGTACYWKIDYYDRALKYGSEDPTDPARTCRVLTIMTTDEY